MTLSGAWTAAAGSVTGRDHRRAERDGQDGHAVVASARVVAAIVTDGCGSGRSSEIGARVGAAWLAALVEQRFDACPSESEARAAACDVSRELVVRLQLLARSFDPEGDISPARIEAALLFGFLAAVVTPSVAIVFGIGDGLFLRDGAATVLDPGPRNAPPYAAYGLLGATATPVVHLVAATSSIATLAVATDGFASPAPLAELPALASDARYARNPSLLRKRLIVLSSEGHFEDDATLAVLQRRRPA